MKAAVQLTFNNKYHVELIDAASGKVKQCGDFHNLTTNNIGSYITGLSSTGSVITSKGRTRIPHQIYVGSGTTQPQASDTSLASPLWSSNTILQPLEWLDDYTARITASVTFPANSSYVGTVTEVAVYGAFSVINYSNVWSTGAMATRSLLTDSEGQQISFNKTDLDILTVTVTIEMSLSSSNAGFEVFKKPLLLSTLLASTSAYDTYFNVVYGNANLCRFHHTLDNYDGSGLVMDYSVSPVSNPSGMRAADSRSGYLEYPVTRVGTASITSERYYKGIAIPGVGFWKLPNEDIFPAYSITGISVGVGDGSTTAFNNPLCYFKTGSDKVYKNGVQLTRGVDYTINSMGNAKCLPEIAEYTTPSRITSAATSSTTLNDWRPLFIPMTGNYPVAGARFLSSSNPLYIEYESAVTMNCLKNNGTWYAPSGTNGYNNLSSSTLFYLDYSIDGINYEQVGQAAYSTSFSIDFENTTAKYWRLRTNSSGSIGMRSSSSTNVPEDYITLNFKDPYIVFAEAPADGDAITMDVEMDIIMKNANFVVDVGARLDFAW